ncbi:MAG: HU family DNA-binding protein [Chloroflexi bacterium]|nr:HU family DNA-binding protein [Chloroflexota bacterium]
MSLNKKTMVREVGRRTRLSNRDVQAVIETLIEVWTEELVAGGRIEIENFMVMTTHPANKRVLVRISDSLRKRIQLTLEE